jgi:hypothetical protein
MVNTVQPIGSASSCVLDSFTENVNIKCEISSFYETQSVVSTLNYKDGHDPERHILNCYTLQQINKENCIIKMFTVLFEMPNGHHMFQLELQRTDNAGWRSIITRLPTVSI